MEALILSCSTGGGHNSAAAAIKEAFESRGHSVTLLDPYSLVRGEHHVDRKVGGAYISVVRHTPLLFGAIYSLGELYSTAERKINVRSPVYHINRLMKRPMMEYLGAHHFDVIIATHLFPSEILTALKQSGVSLPTTIFVATDYTCIPFTEETDCDFFVIPAADLDYAYKSRGIPPEKILPYGIPVRQDFAVTENKKTAAESLGLDASRRYILLSGGSIGAGNIKSTVRTLRLYLRMHTDTTLIVLCGSNEALFSDLSEKYKNDVSILPMKSTDRIAELMRASDMIISKPGGLSSTEAAVSGTPLIHIAPIPGCETKNTRYFKKNGMSVSVGNSRIRLLLSVSRLSDSGEAERMSEIQRRSISPNAALDICLLSESASSGNIS